MKQRRAYATEDRNLRLIYHVEGQLLGSRITAVAVPAAGTTLAITLAITDDDEPNAGYIVEAFSDQIGGKPVATIVSTQEVSGNGVHTISGVTYQGGVQYVFLRIRQDDGNRAWTALFGSNRVVLPAEAVVPPVSLVVDERAETARITNTGKGPVELTGWRLVSLRGNQVFDQFPTGLVLKPGENITVTSGPSAKEGAGFLRWTNQNMWANSGDPGRVIDADGNVVAETGR